MSSSFVVRRSSFVLVLLVTGYWLLVTGYSSYAETCSSNELIERAKELDGKTVTYKGEAVTAVLNRGEYSWINLNDGHNAIGIWCKDSKLALLRFIGDYKHKGDVLEVEGVFNRVCPIHGGELDIHADGVRLAERGFSVKEEWDAKKLKLSIILFLITLSIVMVFRKRI